MYIRAERRQVVSHRVCARKNAGTGGGRRLRQASAAGRGARGIHLPPAYCHACGSTDIKSKCLKCTKAQLLKLSPCRTLAGRQEILYMRSYSRGSSATNTSPIHGEAVTTRMSSRTRCPSASPALRWHEAERCQKEPQDGSSSATGGADVSDDEDERLMTVDQLISLREERALEYLRSQTVRLDSKQQQSDLLKNVSIAISSTSSATTSSSHLRKRKDDATLIS